MAAAEKLLADTKAQVDEGTLAQVELTRANAQVFSTRQDLINSRGLREEQEAILKTCSCAARIWNCGHSAHRPYRRAEHSGEGRIRPMQDLLSDALAQRPDLGQARLQVDNSVIGLAGFAQRAPAGDQPSGSDAEQRAGGPGHGLHIRIEPRLGGRLRRPARAGAGARLSYVRHRAERDATDPQSHRRSGSRRATNCK